MTPTIARQISGYLTAEWGRKVPREASKQGQTVVHTWAAANPTSQFRVFKVMDGTTQSANTTLTGVEGHHTVLVIVDRARVPQQGNNFDCGIFLLSFMEYFLYGLPENLNGEQLACNPPTSSTYPNFLCNNWFEHTNPSRLRNALRATVADLLVEQCTDTSTAMAQAISELNVMVLSYKDKYLSPMEWKSQTGQMQASSSANPSSAGHFTSAGAGTSTSANAGTGPSASTGDDLSTSASAGTGPLACTGAAGTSTYATAVTGHSASAGADPSTSASAGAGPSASTGADPSIPASAGTRPYASAGADPYTSTSEVMGYLEDVTASGLSEREKEALVFALNALKSDEEHQSVDLSDINVVDFLQEELLLLDMVFPGEIHV
jgi:hypothetical protein